MMIDEKRRDLLEEMVCLALLSERDRTYREICQIVKAGGGILTIHSHVGAVLVFLEFQGMISSTKKTEKGKAEMWYYHIEPAGFAHLEQLKERYFAKHRIIMKFLCKEDQRENKNSRR